jgi:hypothetical protein
MQQARQLQRGGRLGPQFARLLHHRRAIAIGSFERLGHNEEQLSDTQILISFILSVVVALAATFYVRRTQKETFFDPPKDRVPRKNWHRFANKTGAAVALTVAYATFLKRLALSGDSVVPLQPNGLQGHPPRVSPERGEPLFLTQLRPTKQDCPDDKQPEPDDKELRRVIARERQPSTRSAALDRELIRHRFALARARCGHLHDVGAIWDLATELQRHRPQGPLIASSHGHKVRDGSFALGGLGNNREVLSFGVAATFDRHTATGHARHLDGLTLRHGRCGCHQSSGQQQDQSE